MIDPQWSLYFNTDYPNYSTLESICSFVNERLSKSKAMRVIFSRAEGVKINEYREHLNYAMQKFEVRPSVKFEKDIFSPMLKSFNPT